MLQVHGLPEVQEVLGLQLAPSLHLWSVIQLLCMCVCVCMCRGCFHFVGLMPFTPLGPCAAQDVQAGHE